MTDDKFISLSELKIKRFNGYKAAIPMINDLQTWDNLKTTQNNDFVFFTYLLNVFHDFEKSLQLLSDIASAQNERIKELEQQLELLKAR